MTLSGVKINFEYTFYKRYFLAFAFVSMAAQVCFAQKEFTEHTIAGNFNGAMFVYAVDVDGDCDMDGLGAALDAGDITWWENNLDTWLRWLALPDSCFVEGGSQHFSLEFLYEHIFSPDFDNEDLVISVEKGEHVFGEMDDEG